MYINNPKRAENAHGCMIFMENRSSSVAILISLTLEPGLSVARIHCLECAIQKPSLTTGSLGTTDAFPVPVT